MIDLDEFFRRVSENVDNELRRILTPAMISPPRLLDAIQWSIFAGGKRFRPALVYASGRAFEVEDRILNSTAASVEMIHTYSLIHDDLPSMDDDDLRRGRETCHKKFGESTAILAGDALQAKAFETIANDTTLADGAKVALISGLGAAASRMVAGQQLDLESEKKALDIEEVKNIHINKTGALVSFAVLAGAVIGNVSEIERARLSEFGDRLGLLFQITDDILDITGSTNDLGKTAGKDAASGKATYPNVIGLEATGRLAADVGREARDSLKTIERDTRFLELMVEFLLARRS